MNIKQIALSSSVVVGFLLGVYMIGVIIGFSPVSPDAHRLIHLSAKEMEVFDTPYYRSISDNFYISFSEKDLLFKSWDQAY